MVNFVLTVSAVVNLLEARERKTNSRAFLNQGLSHAKEALAANVDKHSMAQTIKKAQRKAKHARKGGKRPQGRHGARSAPRVAAAPVVGDVDDTWYGCYSDTDGTTVDDCTCHFTCVACGYSDDPTGSDDCLSCYDGEVTEEYDDGSGACYDDEWWSWYHCVCNEECYYDEEYESYMPSGCSYDDEAGDYDCEFHPYDDENETDGNCPYQGYCECDSDCYFDYDMELVLDTPDGPYCGCDWDYFCNYDTGNNGGCEACYDSDGNDVYATVDDCYTDGLPDAGAAACALECWGIYPNEDYGAGCYYVEYPEYGFEGEICYYMEFDGYCPEEQDVCDPLYGDDYLCNEQLSATKLWMSAAAAAALGLSLI